MTNQAKINNLNYNQHLTNLIDYSWASFWKYYTPSVEIKDFNVLTDGKKVICKLEEDNATAMFFIIEKSEENSFNFSQNSVSII